MPAAAIRSFYEVGSDPLIDRWLRFPRPIATRHDAETSTARAAHLQSAILIGLVLYNVYNFTSMVLLADIFGLSVALRVGLVTSVSLLLVWLIGRTSPQWAERLVLGGALNAFALPVMLFWLTNEPLGLFTFGELALVIVYANMLIALRFRHAVIFTAGAWGLTLLGLCTKADLPAALLFSFIVQISTACVFSLYANYCTERRRCDDYLTTLNARLEAVDAETARRRFHDLSQIDALTALPNRRYLEERLNAWFGGPQSIALMMIDIDHFKLYNDTLGHPAGDDCLRRVADVLGATGPTNDLFCARWGGEEFVLAVRGMTELETVRRAKGLLREIRALAIAHPSRSDGFGIVTISLGVALKPEGVIVTRADVLAAADRALYLAKSRGRNRFVIHESRFDTTAHHAATRS